MWFEPRTSSLITNVHLLLNYYLTIHYTECVLKDVLDDHDHSTIECLPRKKRGFPQFFQYKNLKSTYILRSILLIVSRLNSHTVYVNN